MSFRRSSISLAFLIILGGLGSLVLGAYQAGAQDCVLTIEKVAVPANDFPFNFVVTGDLVTEFTLFDPSDDQINLGLNVGDTITVTEDIVQGWTLENIECIEGVTNCGMGEFIPCLDITIIEGGIIAECLDNDTGSCTFTNVAGTSAIPTLSEWGLIAMAVVIGAAGIFMAMRRRKAAA